MMNKKWVTKEKKEILRAMKFCYAKELSPFFNAKKIKKWRNLIYSFDTTEQNKEYIWEYLNGDLILSELCRLLKK